MEDKDKTRKDAKRFKVKGLDKEAINIADQLTNEQKHDLATMVIADTKSDLDSRSEYDSKRAFWRKQYTGEMDPPGGRRPKGSCTAHMGFLTKAVQNFWSRARQYLMPPKGIANVSSAIGMGLEDKPRKDRLRTFLNFQLDSLMDRFRAEMGMAITQAAIDGSAALKTWWDPSEGRPYMVCVPCEDFIVSYTHTGSIESAERITHRLRLTKDEIRTRVNDGVFLKKAWYLGDSDTDIDDGEIGVMRREVDGVKVATPKVGGSAREIYEQHRFLDLTGSGVGVPVVVTVDKEKETLLRITAREVTNTHGQPETINHFTLLPFQLNPTGFYPLGLGAMLEGVGVAADSFLQQLVDAGSWQNMPPGFYSKKLLKPIGEVRYQFGEMIPCEGMIDDIRKGAYFMDVPQPSQTLFAAFQEMKQEAMEISSVTETMQGLEAPTNQTATTSLVLNKNSMAFFNGVLNLMRDAEGEVLRKIYQLDRLYLDPQTYNDVLGDTGQEEYYAWQQQQEQYAQITQQAQQMMMMGQPLPPQLQQYLMSTPPPPQFPFAVEQDLAPTIDIYPTADPEVTSQVEELQIAERVMATVMDPNQPQPPGPRELWATKKYFLEALHAPAEVIAEVLPEPQEPQPPPNKDQNSENADAMRGQPMFVLPDQNHQEHIEVIRQFKGSHPAFASMSPEGKGALDQHEREHWAMVIEKGEQDGLQAPGPGGQAPPPPGNDSVMGGFPGNPMVPGPGGEGGSIDLASPQLEGRIASLAGSQGLPPGI